MEKFTDSAGHIRITLTTSIISSLVVGLTSAGITWGTFSARLAAAERELQATRVMSATYETRNSQQDIEIATIKAQYNEILRRLDNIDRAVSPGVYPLQNGPHSR
jgi:hypothetical protein